jgi:hypothetical protein
VDVDYAVWVGSAAETTDFAVGDTQHILLVAPGPETRQFTLKDMRYTGRFSDGDRYVHEVDVSWITYVEVILTDQSSHTSASWVFHLERKGTGWMFHEITPPPNAPRMPR